MGQTEPKKTISLFALASFFNDMGSDMVFSVWPLFLTNVLGVNMAVLGFIDGLGDALVSLSQAVSGYVSDRIRRRKIFVWTGYLFGGISRIGYALSTSWPQVIPFRILDRSGKIRSAPRDAIIADISTGRNRGRNFGLLRSMDNLGAVCGILVAIFFLSRLGYRNLFLLAAIPSFLSVVLVALFIKEHKTEDITLYHGIRVNDLDANLKLFLLLSSLFALGSFSYSFLLIYAKQFGFQLGSIPVLYLAFTVVASLSALPLGKLSDSIGRKWVLLLAFLLWGVVLLGLLWLRNHWAILGLFLVYGLHRAAIDTVQKAFVAELAPVEYRASVLGGFQLVVGVCVLPASYLAGVLWDRVNLMAPIYFSLGMTLIAILLLPWVKEKSQTER